MDSAFRVLRIWTPSNRSWALFLPDGRTKGRAIDTATNLFDRRFLRSSPNAAGQPGGPKRDASRWLIGFVARDGCSGLGNFKRFSGGASSGSTGVCDETSKNQDEDARETHDAGPLLQPPFDDGASALDCHQARQRRRYPGDQDEIA